MQPQHDVMGQAGLSFLEDADNTAVIKVWCDIAETEELPVSYFFRSYHDMPLLEQQALAHCRGRVLDVGAGMGSHSLYLQKSGFDVTALELSPLACEVMQRRGVKNIVCNDFFDFRCNTKFDTIFLLMNGIGVVQTLNRLPEFFEQARKLLQPGGQILMDSSDLKYLFLEEDGSLLLDLNAPYYGEVMYKMSFRHYRGNKFPWLFVGDDLLALYAAENGFRFRKLLDGPHYDYLGLLE